MLKRLQQKRVRIQKRSSSHGDNETQREVMQGEKKGGRRRERRRRRGKGKGREKERQLIEGALQKELKEKSKVDRSRKWRNWMETGRHGSGGKMDIESGTEPVTGMEAWHDMGVPPPIIRALKDLGFVSPTEIQQRAIPVAMDTTRDVIGAAETGSGKTLAFAIPILNYVINNDSRAERRGEGNVASGSSVSMATRGPLRMATEGAGEIKAEFIDLNVVLHSEEEEEMDYADESEVTESRDGDSESESLVGDNEGAKGTGLVATLDNIPEDEFLKMIGDDITAGSHDSDDVIEHSDDITTSDVSNNHSRHDLNDVTKESHDLNDVTKGSHDQGLLALILAPTRELALQVQSHIRNAAKYTGIKVCALVGGMAGAKQERLLSQHPPIVVATPGRLWKLMSEGHPYLTSLNTVRYLVLDEADRMIEFGHYQELSWILERINGVRGAESGVKGTEPGTRDGRIRQTFVFSATLTLPRRSTEKKVKVRRRKNLSGQDSVDNLISQVGLRDNPAVVDVSKDSGTVETLSEMKIICSAEEKDAYLYYFLLLYPGRTLVFVNSINTLQKLRSMLELLKLQPLPLHARMQQRQRLKNVDRFIASPNCLLLASDVAARGLDFPNVHHVIHYHVPHNSELYVHRSGRTARAKREGLSVILVGPEDMTAYRNICKTLKRGGIPSFPMDTMYLQTIRKRVSVAKRLEAAMYRRKKAQCATDWLRSSAQAMELELDQDWYGMRSEHATTDTRKVDRVEVLKAELESLLQAPIMPRSVSKAYPTRDENYKLLDRLKGLQQDSWQKGFNQIVTMGARDALQIAKSETLRQKRKRKWTDRQF